MTETTKEIENLKKRITREKNARLAAEKLLEDKSKELYLSNANLNEYMRLLEAAVINAKDAIMITDSDLINGPNIVYVNDAFSRLSGYTKEEAIGKTPRILQGQKTDRETLDRLKETLGQGKSFTGELKNYSKDGTEYWLDISISPVRDDKGDITHFTAIERDITERKKSEKELKEQIEKAETANVSKSEFLANMSHELRTPMNGIIGLSDLLKDTSLDEEQEQSVEAINKSAENLLILLNDILDFSKIEAGEMTLENIPFDLKAVIEETVRLLKSQIEDKGIKFAYHYSPSLPSGLLGDSTRLQQILINLIGNALKFTDSGGEITLSLSRTEDNMMRIVVDDTGVGIPESKLDDIFMKFTQADESTSRRYGGTGLGLSISQKLTELMNGSIGVHSILGQGSSFWFKIPIIEAEIEPQKTLEEEDRTETVFDNAHILVVDDHPINLMYMRKLLKKIGIERIQMVDNGQEAFEYTQVNMYDAILMDCQMPGMDGFETTTAIRKMHQGNALHTPIIAVTANAMKGDREKCIESGMDDYLSKPVDPNNLKQILKRWVKYREIESEQIKTEEIPTTEKTDISEDCPVNIEELRDLFGNDPDDEKMLFDLFFTTSQEAMDALSSAIANKDNEHWRKSAHKIKGSAANLRANNLAEICSKAEQDSECTIEEKKTHLNKIEQELEIVNDFYRSL